MLMSISRTLLYTYNDSKTPQLYHDASCTQRSNVDALDLIYVANNFVSGSKHRLSIFGKFQDTDKKKTHVVVKTKSTQVLF